ncbi:serine hydrolase [Longispora urticae]
MRRTLALVVAATVTATLLVPATAHATPPARPGLERALADLVGTGPPGALVQYRDARGAWTGSAGVAELGRPGRVDPHGVFRIGSVTKTFTSVMVLQLVGERAG